MISIVTGSVLLRRFVVNQMINYDVLSLNFV